jgi:ribosomal protein L11 methyltransferase
VATERAFRIDFTEEQVSACRWATGSRKEFIEIPHRKLGAFVLAAAVARRDVLPVSSSPATLQYMLNPGVHQDDVPAPFVLWLRLTEEQQEKIRAVTGHVLRRIAIAPEEWPVRYVESWGEEPIGIGRRFVVAPDGMPVPEGMAEHVIRMPAANGEGVFGTGRHPATRGALAALEEFMRPGEAVLDVGTGSGILAIAAAQMGAREVLGVDVDEAAVSFARAAVALNGLDALVRIEPGSMGVARGRYDVVLMNLFPQVIVELAPQLSGVLQPHGRIITSGVVEARAERLASDMARAGFQLIGRHADDQWVAQVFAWAPLEP